MPRVFAVTAAATNVRLNSTGRAECSFTVSNATRRSLRGRGVVRASDPAYQGWLKVLGDVERDYPVGATHQVSVAIAVPPGSPTGTCSFRLDVVSAENPDEDFDEGPLVSFEVAASAPPAKSFPWWILIVAAVVLLLIGGVVWWLLSRGSRPRRPRRRRRRRRPRQRERCRSLPCNWRRAGSTIATSISMKRCLMPERPRGGSAICALFKEWSRIPGRAVPNWRRCRPSAGRASA